jgi:hypothetical protein
MAPCNRKCALCPFNNPELSDRALRTLFFAAIYLEAAVPGHHPRLNCMLNCLSKVRDVSELLNCGGDFERAWEGRLLDTGRKHKVAQPVHQGARLFSLLSSAVTPFAIFHDWGLVPLGRWGDLAAVASRGLSATGHLFTATSLLIDYKSSRCSRTANKGIDALSECIYMSLELGMEQVPVGMQATIGVTTGLWGIYKNIREVT